jgi:WD40 repeat protein
MLYNFRLVVERRLIAGDIFLSKTYEFDVALSFAAEDRGFAAELARALTDRNVKVFHYEYLEDALWGEDLYTYLSDLYQNRARYVVMFISKYYSEKLWTNHERKAAQARSFRESEAYILPIRLDDTEIAGILPTTGFVRWPPKTAPEIADMVLRKLEAKTEGILARKPVYKLMKRLRRDGMFDAVAFSPDGSYLLAGGPGLIRWDVGAPKSLDLIRGGISALAFRSDGLVVAVAQGPNVQLWDTSEWKPCLSLKGERSLFGYTEFGSGTPREVVEEKESPQSHGSTIKEINFSPDGSLLATASIDRTVKIWDCHTGRELRMIRLSDSASCATFSPDGRILVLGGSDGMMIMETSEFREVQSIEGDRVSTMCAAFSMDGKSLTTTDPLQVGQVLVWDTDRMEITERFFGSPGDITSLRFSGNTSILGTSDRWGNIRLFDMEAVQDSIDESSGYQVVQVLHHDDAVFDFAFSKEGALLASANRDGVVNIWTLE